jgi:uncharacterized membrane protein (UPF0127 family)
MLALTLLLASACHGPRAAEPPTRAPAVAHATFDLPGGSATFDLEVARTPRARADGLMYRKTLAPAAGMVFVFPDVAPRSFWMKNTYLPLDMIFVGPDHKVVGVVSRAEPLTLSSRGVPAPAKLVIELNGGVAERLGVGPGTLVRFDRLDERVSE